jgi:hypothetical protein
MKATSPSGTSFMRIFTVVAGIFLASQSFDLCHAQIVSPNEFTFKQLKALDDAVRFSIISSNKTMVIDSTNLVRCQLHNLSTNGIFFLNVTHQELDKDGGYQILPLQTKTPTNHLLDGGQTYDWDERVIISNNVKPGHYVLVFVTSVRMPAVTNYYEHSDIFARLATHDLEVAK